MATDSIRITSDDRGRAPLSRLGVPSSAEFLAERTDDGSILLTPVALIPAREMIVWENPDLRRSILSGLAESSAGKTITEGEYFDDLDSLDVEQYEDEDE